ncbi:hypothetical protein IGM40_09415 [Campylobacter jejuni]|uniref:hypothetical protein n=1 Tax=Campylobacter jejuni TaxID=197 RepID=UPI00138EB092|nr:hypothetical protein [Campylobacter jejuni]ECQ6960363.1 hypothetical protein [Campylobacter jejuni]EDP4548345.1 hypothetical protein [Campylobacter jejuni]EDP7250480.1 hypothetical protein [Campylobacter jejuni]MBO7015352.1 hypothetical protein [Campylobacter jejuni]MBO7022195.1 hypothetical protein [Campylobacter jejuni]
MFKNVIKFATLSILISSSAIAEDILAKVSNGTISDNSAGVKVLNFNEMKEVKGGFNFIRNSRYDNIAGIRSYAYVVTDADNSQLQISSNSKVIAKYRYVNNQKDYYLQSYNNGTLGTIFPNYSTSWGQYAMKIMNEFKSKY